MISKPSLKSEKKTNSPAQSTGLGWRRSLPEIAARWRCVSLIKKMTAHYNSQNSGSQTFNISFPSKRIKTKIHQWLTLSLRMSAI